MAAGGCHAPGSRHGYPDREKIIIKLVIPVDGSACSDHAVQAVIRRIQSGAAVELYLVNVQPPLPGAVVRFAGREAVAAQHDLQGQQALGSARALLEGVQIPYQAHVAVGNAAAQIIAYADRVQAQGIVMGVARRGRWLGLRFNDLAAEVIRRAHVPVEVVPMPSGSPPATA